MHIKKIILDMLPIISILMLGSIDIMHTNKYKDVLFKQKVNEEQNERDEERRFLRLRPFSHVHHIVKAH